MHITSRYTASNFYLLAYVCHTAVPLNLNYTYILIIMLMSTVQLEWFNLLEFLWINCYLYIYVLMADNSRKTILLECIDYNRKCIKNEPIIILYWLLTALLECMVVLWWFSINVWILCYYGGIALNAFSDLAVMLNVMYTNSAHKHTSLVIHTTDKPYTSPVATRFQILYQIMVY